MTRGERCKITMCGLKRLLITVLLVGMLTACGSGSVSASIATVSAPAAGSVQDVAQGRPLTASSGASIASGQSAVAASSPIIAPAPTLAGSAMSFRDAVRLVAQRVKPAVVQITNEQVTAGFASQPFTIPAGGGFRRDL